MNLGFLGKLIFIILTGLWIGVFSSGCADLNEEQMAHRVTLIQETMEKAGVHGTMTFTFEDQDFRAGMFNGFEMRPPIKMTAVVTASIDATHSTGSHAEN